MQYLIIALMWVAYEPIRNVANPSPEVADIESHLPAGHPYRDQDRITWVHEGTHGINGIMRQKYNCPAFYVMNDGVALLNEPGTTLAAIARVIPMSFRGEIYNLYLIQAQSSWNKQPSYILDEWVAYTNGSEARLKLGIQNRSETVRYMMEFCIYSYYLTEASNDSNVAVFYEWQLDRCLTIYHKSGVRCEIFERFITNTQGT